MSDNSLLWRSTHRSDTGLVRRINEDACLDLPEQGVWVVADGMGGHAAGELASRAIVDALRRMEPGVSLGHLADAVKQRLLKVNQELQAESKKEEAGSSAPPSLPCWRTGTAVSIYGRGTAESISIGVSDSSS